MSDVLEHYKVPGSKVKTRTFVISEVESVQVRLNLIAPAALPDKPVSGHGHTASIDKE